MSSSRPNREGTDGVNPRGGRDGFGVAARHEPPPVGGRGGAGPRPPAGAAGARAAARSQPATPGTGTVRYVGSGREYALLRLRGGIERGMDAERRAVGMIPLADPLPSRPMTQAAIDRIKPPPMRYLFGGGLYYGDTDGAVDLAALWRGLRFRAERLRRRVVWPVVGLVAGVAALLIGVWSLVVVLAWGLATR